MSETLILAVAAVLAIGGILAAAITTCPRPSTVREILYLVVPVAGVIVLVVATWARG